MKTPEPYRPNALTHAGLYRAWDCDGGDTPECERPLVWLGVELIPGRGRSVVAVKTLECPACGRVVESHESGGERHSGPHLIEYPRAGAVEVGPRRPRPPEQGEGGVL